MNPLPRVSVITIFRDAERFLPAAIASIEAQSIPDWELLLIDDGSRDGGGAFAREQAARDPARIRFFEHPRHASLGTSASRNLGIRHARAACIAFLDADDVYLPQRLERHLQVLDARPDVGMVQSDSVYWIAPRDDDDVAAEHRQRQGLWRDGTVLEPPEALVAMLSLPPLHVFTCDITLRRELLERIGGFEARFGGTHEDLVLFAKVYLTARVLVCGEFLAKVRRHSGSFTHQTQHEAHRVDGMYQRDARAFHAWLGDHLRAQAVTDPMLQARLADLASAGAGVRRRGWFIRLRSIAFDLLARFAPRAFHLSVVKGYRSVVRYHAQRRFRALRAEARRLGLHWSE